MKVQVRRKEQAHLQVRGGWVRGTGVALDGLFRVIRSRCVVAAVGADARVRSTVRREVSEVPLRGRRGEVLS